MKQDQTKPATVQDGALTPTQLLSQAIGAGVSIEQLEKLMELQERWEARQAKKAFDEAMAAFQAEKPDIKKTSTVDYTSKKTGARVKYNYAPLPAIQKAIDPVLARHGLSYTWTQEVDEKMQKVTCILKHVGGHSESNEMVGPNDDSSNKSPLQGIGHTNTFLKRYTLSNATGTVTDEDIDGGTPPSPEEIAEFRLNKIIDLRMEHENALTDHMLKRLDEIIAKKESASYEKAIKTIEKLIK